MDDRVIVLLGGLGVLFSFYLAYRRLRYLCSPARKAELAARKHGYWNGQNEEPPMPDVRHLTLQERLNHPDPRVRLQAWEEKRQEEDYRRKNSE